MCKDIYRIAKDGTDAWTLKHEAAKVGITVRYRTDLTTGLINGVSFERNGIRFQGGKLDRSLSSSKILPLDNQVALSYRQREKLMTPEVIKLLKAGGVAPDVNNHKVMQSVRPSVPEYRMSIHKRWEYTQKLAEQRKLAAQEREARRDMEAMSKDVSSISEQLPALVATRTEINDFKNKVETYDKKLAEATAVINNGVDVRVDPAKLSGEDLQMLEDLRDKFDHWNLRWDKIWKAIANTSKIKVYLTGIMSSALSVLITLLVCYDSSYIWAHRAFIASEAKYDENPGSEYSKTYIDMKGTKEDRKRAKEHVEGLESEADYIEFHEKILSNYIDEEFELREYKVRIKDEQMVWVVCYHPLTDKMINYRVHTAPDGLVLKVEQELTKQSKRVGWKELQLLNPEEETDAT